MPHISITGARCPNVVFAVSHVSTSFDSFVHNATIYNFIILSEAHALQGERRIRGTGVYHMSSLLNHDCMPNVARYDDFDSTIEENTIVEFRALHDIPADTQITQSYFPLSWQVMLHAI